MTNQELQTLKNKFDIIGNDPALNRALEIAVAVAPTDITVLVMGALSNRRFSNCRALNTVSRFFRLSFSKLRFLSTNAEIASRRGVYH